MSSIFDFDVEEERIPPSIQRNQPEDEPESDSIFDFIEETPALEEPESKPSTLSEIGRHGGRTGARVAETILGAPRAFGEFLEGLVPEKALIKGAEAVGLGEGAKNLLETTKKLAPYKLFPTSQQVREFNEDLFGESVKPKNEWERKADDLVSDFAALSLPTPGGKVKVLKPLLLSLGGNIASEVTGRLGGSEKAQTNAKLGTFLFGSLVNPKGAEKFKNELYSKARENRPANAKVTASGLTRRLDNLEKELKKGDPKADFKRKTFELVDTTRKKIAKKEISVEELEKLKVDINAARANLYEEFKTNKPGRKMAKANLDSISKAIDDTLTDYGKTNPAWEAYYRPANEAHGAIAQSQKARNFIKRNYKTMTAPSALALFGIEQAAGPVTTGVALGAGALAIKSGEIAAQIAKSPKTLGKYYANVVNAAIKEDAVAMRENLRKLEEALKKEEED